MGIRRWEWPYRFGYTFSGNLSQYIYAPFRPPANFRLLELRSGSRSGLIECDLLNTSLENAPGYEALSYRWGDLADTKEIVCGGRNFRVTHSLHTALLNLRHHDRNRILWVDALCINQRDYSERNQQLRLMGKIYRRADRVIVWMGEDFEAAGAVKTLFEQLHTLGARFGGTVYLNSSTNQLSELGLPESSSPVWSALRYFFRRAWFQRVWVIQEAANASAIEVHCGSTTLDWDDMVFAARCVADSPMFAASDTAAICRHLCFIDECRQRRQQASGDSLSLFDLLYRSRRCDATDLRDKIYGLYPLVNDENTLPKPDYEEKVDMVYKKTVAHLIRTTGRLDVLSFAGAARDPRTRFLNLPSWVPDWHSYDKATPLTAPAQAPVTAEAEPTYTDMKFSDDYKNLTVPGGILDSIASISDTILPFQGTLQNEVVNFLLRQWPDAKTELEPTGETVRILDVFAQALTSDDFNILSLPNKAFTTSWLMSERNRLTQIVYGRRVFRSASGLLGLAPSYATVQDKIVCFERGSVPYVIRPDGDSYTLIGECFFLDLSRKQHQTTEITLK